MIRRLLAIVAGVFAAVLTVGIVEGIGHAIFPPPPGADVSNPEALAELMPSLAFGAKAFVVLAWGLGSLIGGWVAARVARGRGVGVALVVGLFMLAAGGYTIASIPHPAWMAALGLLLPLPMSWLGGRLQATA